MLNYFSSPQNVIALAKDAKKVLDEGEVTEESLQKAATIMLNYENLELASIFSTEEQLCGLSFLVFLKALFKYLLDSKGKNYIEDAKEKVHSDSGSSSFETGKVTDEAKEVIMKIQHQQNKKGGLLTEVNIFQ